MTRTDDTDTGEAAAAAGDTGEDMSGTEAVPPRTRHWSDPGTTLLAGLWQWGCCSAGLL